MIMAGTGHRPNKLGGYGLPVFKRLVALATAALKKYKPEKVISGFALGWDLALAHAATELKIYTIASLPCLNHSSNWPSDGIYKQIHDNLLQIVNEQIIVTPQPYQASLMHKRDRWMVDNATCMLALWNGSPGGTGYTVGYAKEQAKPVVNLWRSWEKYK